MAIIRHATAAITTRHCSRIEGTFCTSTLHSTLLYCSQPGVGCQQKNKTQVPPPPPIFQSLGLGLFCFVLECGGEWLSVSLNVIATYIHGVLWYHCAIVHSMGLVCQHRMVPLSLSWRNPLRFYCNKKCIRIEVVERL